MAFGQETDYYLNLYLLMTEDDPHYSNLFS